MAATGEPQYHGEAAEQGDEQIGQPGETLAAEEADDQVENQPDQNADAEYQQAERAHELEFVLAEFGAQGGGGECVGEVRWDEDAGGEQADDHGAGGSIGARDGGGVGEVAAEQGVEVLGAAGGAVQGGGLGDAAQELQQGVGGA